MCGHSALFALRQHVLADLCSTRFYLARILFTRPGTCARQRDRRPNCLLLKEDGVHGLQRVDQPPLSLDASWQALSLREHVMKVSIQSPMAQQPWNQNRLVGQKPSLRLSDIWAIRVRVQLRHAARDLGPCIVRACHRQKIARGRLSQATGSRSRPRCPCFSTRTGSAAENSRPLQFEIT